jgi:hypothetical protein
MGRSLLCVGLLQLVSGVLLAGPLECQSAHARVEENLRGTPNGVLLGVLRPGAPLLVQDRRDAWLGVEIEGWMWERSLQVRSQGGFDLVVSEQAGENLREQPAGPIIARLATGTLLIELERRPAWVRVRRAGWIWGESVEVSRSGSDSRTAATVAPASNAPSGRQPTGNAPSGPSSNGRAAGATGRLTVPTSAAEPSRESSGETTTLVVGGSGAAVLNAPLGDTVATALAHATLQVTSREGNWARVRLEGWMWAPASDSAAPAPAAFPPAILDDVLPAQVVADPARFARQVIRWDLQFISLERAERIRTDFAEGEPFLLTRSVAGPRFFIYVAVPPELLARVSSLAPLEQIRVVGRVRTGASPLTGGPIIELIEIQGSGRSPE